MLKLCADHHEPSLGQEPALTDIPHMGNSGTPGNYQAMIVEDDDWLHDFALSQLQPSSLPAAHAVNSLDPEQSTEPTVISAPAVVAAVGGSQEAAEQESSGEATHTQVCFDLGLPGRFGQGSCRWPCLSSMQAGMEVTWMTLCRTTLRSQHMQMGIRGRNDHESKACN